MSRRIADRGFVVLAVASVLLLVWLGRGLTFYADEWAFIADRSLADPSTWFAPHNEHWSTLPILVNRVLVETIGLRTYVPYLLLLALINIAVAWLVRRQVERRIGPAGGLAAGALVLFLGAGFENLLWGFQIGFLLAACLGMAAADILDGRPSRGRALAVGVCLIGSVMSSGPGLFWLAGMTVEVIVDGRWRRWWRIAVGPPIVAFAVWFAATGHGAIGAYRDPTSLSAIAAIPAFVAGGLVEAGAALTGLGSLSVIAVGMVAGMALLDAIRRQRLPGRFLGMGAAVVTAYVLLALARAGITTYQVQYPRYTYLTAVLTIVAVAAYPGPRIAAWLATLVRHRQRGARLAGLAIPAIWLTLAITWNLGLLVGGRSVFVEHAAMTRALVAASLDPNPPPGADRTRWLILTPAPVVLERLVARFGSPLSDSVLPWAVEDVRPELLAEARRRLVEGPPIYQPVDID